MTDKVISKSAEPSPPLNSRAIVALTGLSYFCIAVSFSYLDRSYGFLDGEGIFWGHWAALGFGAGILHARSPLPAGEKQWKIVGTLAAILCVFPAFFKFNLLRWLAVSLLLVIGARAVVLRTRRDFHLTLTVIFVVSFMVGTHGRADWTLWFYLGPAWVLGGLALAWEHASGVVLSRWIKIPLTLGFILLAFLLSVVLFFFAPRPPILGFGFLPPGTDTPGMFKPPAAMGGDASKSGQRPGIEAGQGAADGLGQSELARRWDSMLKDMRKALSDKFIPQWQRGLMQFLLDTAQSLFDRLTGQAMSQIGATTETETVEEKQLFSFKVNWLLLLALWLAAYFIWLRRFRIGIQLVLWSAWAAVPRWPAASMRMSALAMKWCLRQHGYAREPGQSVREHWNSGVKLAPLAKQWLGYAVESYCAMRFGGRPASPRDANNMRKAVQGASDIMAGIAPELAR